MEKKRNNKRKRRRIGDATHVTEFYNGGGNLKNKRVRDITHIFKKLYFLRMNRDTIIYYFVHFIV